VLCRVQVVPFHASAADCVPLPAEPTPVHAVCDVQDTPERESGSVPGLRVTVLAIVQALPFHCSASVVEA
jgi:hypothetical protein